MRNAECGMRNGGNARSALVPIPHSAFRIPHWTAVGLTGAGMCVALTALFAVGPLLQRLARPEWLIYMVLVVNPFVAMGTALNLDVLRTPWIYQWTPIPEYRFAYPAPVWTLALYVALAGTAMAAASRRLERGN